jgi:hypothetical protein
MAKKAGQVQHFPPNFCYLSNFDNLFKTAKMSDTPHAHRLNLPAVVVKSLQHSIQLQFSLISLEAPFLHQP